MLPPHPKPENAIDTAVLLARFPLLQIIRRQAAEIERLRAHVSALEAVASCACCAFRQTQICRRCADNPNPKPPAKVPENSKGLCINLEG